MKPRLQLKPKNKVRVSVRVRLVRVGAVFAVAVATAFLLYYNLGTPDDSIASEETTLQGFSHRNKILVSKDIIRGTDTLFNFPVLVSIENKNLRNISHGGYVIHPKGFDIRITGEDAVKLYSTQIESYDAEKGLLNIWVLFDTLSSKSNNDLFIYYGNPTLQNELPVMVWNNSYEAVWHFNSDAKAGNTRKINTSQSGIVSINGKFDKAYEFSNERKDYISVNYIKNLDFNSDFTFSAWILLKNKDRKQVILENHGDNQAGYSFYIDENNRLSAGFYNTSGKYITFDAKKGEELETDKWYHVCVVFSKQMQSVTTFIDGISDRTLVTPDVPAPSAASLQIGRSQFDSEYGFTGIIDELRISSVARNQNWIATAFYNETLANQLFTLDATENLALRAEDIKQNKQAFGNASEQAREKTERENLLVKKTSNSDKPVAISAGREVLQAKLHNIKRISEQNN